jgi:hypothetical protein
MRIKVKEVFRGTHKWPCAGDSLETQPVAFLSSKHAHDFKISVMCNVSHEDRELEFFLLRNSLREIINHSYDQKDYFYCFGDESCEAIGKKVLKELISFYGSRNWVVQVGENDNQSAIVYEEKKEVEKVMDVDKLSYDRVLKKARSIFVERQGKYGNSVNEIDLHTIVGLMRMKLFRIYNEGADPKTEDELLDCINYAVFAMTRLEEKKDE